jgi:hypothetical protein
MSNIPTGGLGGTSRDVTYIIGGTGANIVTINVVDGDSNPIEGVSVFIWNSSNTTFITRGRSTDSSGNSVVNLDNGVYAVRLVKLGYSFTFPEVLTVSGDTSAQYVGSVFAIPPSPGSGIVGVYLYLYDESGETPVSESLIDKKKCRVLVPYIVDDAKAHYGEWFDGTYDSETGALVFYLPDGCNAEFVIEPFGIRTKRVVDVDIDSSGTFQVKLYDLTEYDE